MLARRDASLDDQRVVLRVTNPFLNDVRRYDPLQNSGTFIVTGDAHPNTRTELDLSSLTFLLPIGDEPRNVYVAVRTSSSMVFSVVLEPIASALKSNRTYDLLAGLYLSKQIAQMLGGDLTFRPNSSELVFELVLPRQISQRAK